MRTARSRARDVDAFNRLIEHHGTGLYRLGAGIVGVANAPDVFQEALLSMWTGMGGLRDPDRFLPWARRILVNKCRDHLRRQKRTPRIEPITVADDLLTSDFRSAVDLRTTLDQAFERLPVDHRALLVLHYATGLSIQDSAATLQIPLGTAKSRLSAALSALRGSMHDVER